MPRASWFPVIFVGVPSCQTDWLFTNDPVNQKSPSKALSPYEIVTGIKSFGKSWDMMGRRKRRGGEETRKSGIDQRHETPSSVLWWPGVTTVSLLLARSCVRVPWHAGASHVTRLSGRITRGRASSQLAFLSPGNFRASCCCFSSGLISWTRLWTSHLGLLFSEQRLWVVTAGNSLVPEKNWIPSHPCAFWNNVPLPVISDPGKCF